MLSETFINNHKPAELIERYELIMQDFVFKESQSCTVAEKAYFCGKVEREPKIIETRQIYPQPHLDTLANVFHPPEKVTKKVFFFIFTFYNLGFMDSTFRSF